MAMTRPGPSRQARFLAGRSGVVESALFLVHDPFGTA